MCCSTLALHTSPLPLRLSRTIGFKETIPCLCLVNIVYKSFNLLRVSKVN
nr:MAG TPA: hypothetical protein [Crassvirales sp.]DAO83063.1 MAG TPA: hypothetical protein [Bacteriophage sp.]